MRDWLWKHVSRGVFEWVADWDFFVFMVFWMLIFPFGVVLACAGVIFGCAAMIGWWLGGLLW